MRSAQFRKASRAIAWLFLAWVGIDLGYPSLCALDQENPLNLAVATSVDAASPDGTTPVPPAHIDDCFCCSHCVDVSSIASSVPLWSVVFVPLPIDRAPFPSGYPPYHPPRV